MAWAELVLKLVSLLSSFVSWLKSNQLIKDGEDKEIAAELTKQSDEIAKAKVAEDAATKAHLDPTDQAFDQDFFRKD